MLKIFRMPRVNESIYIKFVAYTFVKSVLKLTWPCDIKYTTCILLRFGAVYMVEDDILVYRIHE